MPVKIDINAGSSTLPDFPFNVTSSSSSPSSNLWFNTIFEETGFFINFLPSSVSFSTPYCSISFSIKFNKIALRTTEFQNTISWSAPLPKILILSKLFAVISADFLPIRILITFGILTRSLVSATTCNDNFISSLASSCSFGCRQLSHLPQSFISSPK